MVKAVIFDMDGVLINSEPTHQRVWKEFFAQRGIDLTEEQLHKTRGITAKAVIRMIMPQKTSEEEIIRLQQERIEIYKKILENGIEMVPGIGNFIRSLKSKNLLVGVATSSIRSMAYKILRQIELFEYFDVIVCGDEVRQGKPDPEIYLKAAEKLHVSPAECLVFEDSFTGVTAAQTAGMKVVAVTTSHPASAFHGVVGAYPDFRDIPVTAVIS